MQARKQNAEENHIMQVYDMQRGNKSEAKNHGKAGDARHKIGNRGPTACMGVKACTRGNKMQKATTKMKLTLKIVSSKL